MLAAAVVETGRTLSMLLEGLVVEVTAVAVATTQLLRVCLVL
jgi:hypothetical protein